MTKSKPKKLLSLIFSACLLLGIFLVIFKLTSKPAQAAWYNDSWQYRTRIAITNTGAAVTNQKVKFDIATDTLVTAGKIQSDCGDSRFVSNTGEVLRYYLDTAGGACNTASTDYYVLIPSINAGSVVLYHYYGNPAIANGTEGANFSESTFAPNSIASATEEKGKGPIGYWKFDEGADNTCVGGTNDVCNAGSSASTLDGTSTATRSNSGKFNKALDLDGTDDVVTVINTTAIDFDTGLNTGVTFSGWVNPDTVGEGSAGEIFRKSATTFCKLGGTTLFNLSCSLDLGTDSTLTINSVIPASTWTHIAMVWTDDADDEISVYINGILRGTSTDGVGPNSTDSSDLLIGGGTSNNWDGKIDEFKVYNYELSTSEIKVDYNRGVVAALSGEYYDGSNPPIGYWKLDEKSGTSAIDSSGNDNTATMTNSPSWTIGKFGSGVSFSGSNQHIIRADDSDFDFADGANMSIALWFKHATASAQEVILSKFNEAGYKVIMESDGDITCALDYDSTWTPTDSATSTAATYDDNNWHHIACVKTGASSLALYIDGILITTDSSLTVTNTLTNSDPLYFGIDADGTSNDFTGALDDIKIYNYARTQKQIVSDMNAGHPNVGSPVGSAIGYWKFDEGADNTCIGGTNDVCNTGSNASTLDGTSTATRSNSGKFNKALDFDGADDVVTVTNVNAIDFDTGLNTGVTFSGWINPDTVGEGSAGELFRKSATTFCRLGGSTPFNLSCSLDLTTDATITISSVIPASTWSHVAMVWTDDADDEIVIYINGVKRGNSGDGVGPNTADSSNLLLGGDTLNNFDGKIDEFKVYGYELSGDEVKLDYNRGSAIVLGVEDTGQNLVDGAGNSPVAEWRLNEKIGSSALDTSGNSRTGTITGAEWKTAASCKTGSCLQFDSTDRVDTYDTGFTTTFSGSAFIKPTAVNTTYAIMGERAGSAGWAFYVRATGELGFTLAGVADYNSSGAGLVANQWSHVAFTVSGTAVRIYLNGRLVHSPTMASNVTSDSTRVYIGNDASTNYFSGLIDEIKLYNYTRTPAQVAQDFNNAAPVAWWRFDECQGATAYNAAPSNDSFNAQNGTLTPVSSGNTTTGSCNSGTTTEMWNDGTTGKFDSSLGLDGTDDYVTVADHNNIDQASSTSIAAWVYVNTLKNYNQIFTKGIDSNENYEAYITSTGSIGGEWTFNTGRAGCSSSGNINLAAGAWYHFVVTFESGVGCKNYINGSLVSNLPKTATTLTTFSTPLIIGADTSAAGRYFDGRIDDVRIYNYTLSANQVKQVMNQDATVRFSE